MTVLELLKESSGTKRRVISYTRFSSRKQAKGLSYSRQIEAAKEWCEEHGLTLDESDQFADLGVSAFSGANAETGALSVLQDKLKRGEIERGTVLIVEALDRITRQALSKAITLLMNLVNSGLTVVTLSDKRVWDEAALSDLGSFMMSVVTLYRGHQESEFKSMRLRKTFKKHRDTGSQVAFGSAPGWLARVDKNSPWTVDEALAEVVVRVFELSAAGFGSKAIAARANAEGWPVPTRLAATGKRWHGQMPGQLLRNRAVLGEHQHRVRTYEAHAKCWKGEAQGDVLKDYYPRIVSNDLWLDARSSISKRMTMKRRDENFYNVFSTLMFCGRCGAPIHRKNEKKGYSRAQLNCSDRLGGATACKTMAAACADPPLLRAIFEQTGASLSTTEGGQLLGEKAAIETELASKRKQQERLVRAIMDGLPLPGLEAQAQDLADDILALDLRLQVNEVSLSLVSMSSIEDIVVDDVLQYLYSPGDKQKEKRATLHLQLARLVSTVWIWPYDVALVQLIGADDLIVVELMHKQLPSRGNPSAKYHKAPPPRVTPEKPFLALARARELMPPTPRRTSVKAMKPQGEGKAAST